MLCNTYVKYIMTSRYLTGQTNPTNETNETNQTN